MNMCTSITSTDLKAAVKYKSKIANMCNRMQVVLQKIRTEFVITGNNQAFVLKL